MYDLVVGKDVFIEGNISGNNELVGLRVIDFISFHTSRVSHEIHLVDLALNLFLWDGIVET